MYSLSLRKPVSATTGDYDTPIPKPAWSVPKPSLWVRIERLLTRCYGRAGMLAIHR